MPAVRMLFYACILNAILCLQLECYSMLAVTILFHALQSECCFLFAVRMLFMPAVSMSFRTLRATAAPSTYGPGNWGETTMADHPLIQTLGKTWTRIKTQNDAENH